MQGDNIIEKAKKLGIDTGTGNQENRIRTIAEQLGVEDLEELDQTLDSMLDDSDGVEFLNNDDRMVLGEELYNDYADFEDDGSENNEAPSKKIGEEEYEKTVGDKDYYKNEKKDLENKLDENKTKQEEAKKSQEEAKKKRDEAKEQKKNSQGTESAKNDKRAYRDANREYKKAKRESKTADRAVKNTQRDLRANKLNNIKSKMYQTAHPLSSAKSQLKSKAASAAKSGAKKAGKAAAKGAAKAGKAIGQAAGKGLAALGKLIVSNPYVLLAVVIIVLIIFIIILIMMVVGSDSGQAYMGLYGYAYVEPKCTEITISEGEHAGTYDIEEYVAGVVQAEVGGFIGGTRNEAAKAGAVAARSFVQANVNDSCTVISSQSFQVYTTPSDGAIQIANETRGLVLVDSSGDIKSTQYDAFCTASPQDDPDNYIVCQKSQKIPRSWVDAQSGIADSWKEGTMSGAHGNGMSQWGAAYLAEQGKDFKEILAYYYDETELRSIYPSFEITNNWTQTIDTSTSSSIATTIMRTPLNDLLGETRYNELNELIYEGVVSSGVGTRGAITAAAVTPIKYLAENYNVVIPYTLGGGHYMGIYSNATGANIQKTTTTYYGVDPDWGTVISHTWDGNYYDEYGPDCSAWVPWVFHNAGVSMSPGLASDFQYLGTKHSMNSGYTAQPGDILENDHHVTVVVGVDESANLYYIAHARGGSYGTVITSVSFNSDSYYIVEMTDYIESHRLDAETYETNYKNGVLEY